MPARDDAPIERYLLHASETYALAVLRPLQRAIREARGEAAWFFDGPGAGYLRPDERRLTSVEEVRAFDPRAVFVPGNSVPDWARIENYRSMIETGLAFGRYPISA